MPANYDEPADDAVTLIADLLALYHQGPDGLPQSIDVRCWFAFAATNKAGEITGNALRVRGGAAYACVRITSPLERVQGLGDALILIDGDNWTNWTAERKAALIDHELEHIAAQRDKDGTLKLDDRGRPKLGLRPHDWEFGGFNSIARRHRDHSFEHAAVDQIGGTLVRNYQLSFDWPAHDEAHIEHELAS